MEEATTLSDGRPVGSGLETAPPRAAWFPEVLANSLPYSQPATQIFPYIDGFLRAERMNEAHDSPPFWAEPHPGVRRGASVRMDEGESLASGPI